MINLLPPVEKEQLLQEQRYRLLLIWGVLAVVFLITLSLVLFSVKIYISGKIQGEKIFIPLQLQDQEKEVRSINQNLRSLSSFYDNQPNFTALLKKIPQILPEDIYLTSLSSDSVKESGDFLVSLQGFSQTRELLFQLKKNLELNPGIKDMYFPPSNWLKAEDIEFIATFKIGP